MCVSGMDFAYVYTIYFIRNSSDSNVFVFLYPLYYRGSRDRMVV